MKNNIGKLSVFTAMVFLIACGMGNSGSQEIEKHEAITSMPPKVQGEGQDLLDKCILAHGGMQRWNEFEGLAYTLINNGTPVYQLTHLKDRRAFIESEAYTVGYNGAVAWALPDASKLPGKSVAFYYNLDFYFVGIPFVLMDPGVKLEDLGVQRIDSTDYLCLKVAYGESVGLTPDDVYFLYLDPSTYMLRILVYSITYFKDTPPDQAFSSAKVYSGYQYVQGIMMPGKMENFVWQDGSLGTSKNHVRLFKDYQFLTEIEDKARFEPPQDAKKESIE
ncbi:MAG: hypothetical protein HKN87_21490 [Saprospiraceae bacterium]|nr:hypothetical protein [Saprospiraceae bacterium]